MLFKNFAIIQILTTDMKPVYLRLSVPEKELPVCSSRFLGNPDLPSGYGYPCFKDEDGDDYPYFFVCQINLEEFSRFDTENRLPKHGLPSFFAKIDYYAGYSNDGCISGYISSPEDVKVIYFPECLDFEEIILVDDDGNPTSPPEMQIKFSHSIEKYGDEHAMFANPDHREWETWDPPFENWEILLQIDSFSCNGVEINFMDCGVLDFLIDPEDLKNHRFDNVRAIVLST